MNTLTNCKISVVMPAYNEAKHIVSNLIETVQTLHDCKYNFEVILVDDGSPDKTYLEAAKLLSSHPDRVRVVHYDENRGKGNALSCGTHFAAGKYVVFLDADMDLHPVQLPVLLEMMVSTNADIVIGSKRHPASKVNYPKFRILLSAVYYFFVRLLFKLPVRDTQTGLKVFKTEALKHVLPFVQAARFAFDIELLALAHKLGYKIAEAPVTLDFRRVISRIKLRDVYDVFVATLAIYYRVKVKKIPATMRRNQGSSLINQATEIKLHQLN
ncbi:MAG: glycosyltransferase [Candidatus Eremiobacteraeota bacterium]|nr:glycosyltransferase [Candidatus Eremiobacteraeota bacterium]